MRGIAVLKHRSNSNMHQQWVKFHVSVAHCRGVERDAAACLPLPCWQQAANHYFTHSVMLLPHPGAEMMMSLMMMTR